MIPVLPSKTLIVAMTLALAPVAWAAEPAAETAVHASSPAAASMVEAIPAVSTAAPSPAVSVSTALPAASTAAAASPVLSTAALRDAANAASAGIEWIAIASGTFMMGVANSTGEFRDAQPAHLVTIKPFKMAKTEVTNKQYKACVEAGACAPPHYADKTCWVWNGKQWIRGVVGAEFQADSQPVVCVDWRQAAQFSAWVGGRLPSEAEWEYAARSQGQDYDYPWGNERATCERAIIDDPPFGLGCGRRATWPVCSKPKGNSKQGLCDLAGNAWEWTADDYHSSYKGAPTDGGIWSEHAAEEFGTAESRHYIQGYRLPPALRSSKLEQNLRVKRGGSCFDTAVYARSAYRDNAPARERRHRLGFRPVLPSP